MTAPYGQYWRTFTNKTNGTVNYKIKFPKAISFYIETLLKVE